MVALVLAWTPRTLHLAVSIFLNIVVKVTIWMWIVTMLVDPNRLSFSLLKFCTPDNC